jgi:hypothetical protein
MSVVSDASDDTPLDANIATLDDGLRTLIITTGIWVAFREGWSHNFSYGDPVSSSARSVVSPASSRHASPTVAKNDHDAFPDNDEASPTKGSASGMRCMSISSVRRSNTTAAADDKQFGSLSKRSNSTGAAFMERAKRRSASGLSTRLNRHSMFTTGEHGRDIVVSRSRPASIRQNSSESEEPPRPVPSRAKTPNLKPEKENKKHTGPDKDLPASTARQGQKSPRKEKPDAPKPEAVDSTPKLKRRHRLSTFFNMFSRKHDNH